MKKPVALTIAGSDPSGGAGIQADLKTFHQRGVYGMSVLTLLTVQNTTGVREVWILEPEKVLAQLRAVLEDIPPQAAKTGALGNAGVIRALAHESKHFRFPLVVDPVMVSKHGALLLDRGAAEVLKKELLPNAALVTPNLHEAEILSGIAARDERSMENAARKISELGPRAVLVKGGHLDGEAIDLLFHEGEVLIFRAEKVKTQHTHGTGCTFSAAITAELAKGCHLHDAIRAAKKYITLAIQGRPGLGEGAGPVNHHA